MSELNKYTNASAEEFQNIENVNADALWNKIQGQMPNTQNSNGWNIQMGRYWKWSIAASVAILIAAAVSFWPQQNDKINFTFADFFPEYLEEAENYQQLIKQKESELQLNELDPSRYQDIFEELALLEEIHQEFISDLPAYGDQERLLQIMTKYYEQKIKMLDRLSREIQKQHSKKDDDEILL